MNCELEGYKAEVRKLSEEKEQLKQLLDTYMVINRGKVN